MRIPAVIDIAEPRWQQAPPDIRHDTLQLLFLGSPNRDRIDLILQGMQLLRQRGQRVTLSFLGTTREALTRLHGGQQAIIEQLGDALNFYGRVSTEEVVTRLAQADFLVLLREQARWSQACFPSKLPEGLVLGVPILSNITSDIGEYIHDAQEGIIVPALSAEAFAGAVERALALTDEERQHMRQAARLRAEESFDYRRYRQQLATFMRAAG